MKRRQAIRQIAVVSSGLALLPSCNFQSSTAYKSYKHLPLKNKQYQLIDALQAAILPPENMPADIPESPLDYMLTKINDCYSMDDIQKYIAGLNDFQQYISNTFNKPFKKLNIEQKTQALNSISTDEKLPKSVKSFVQTNKKLTVEYFTQSEAYQVNHFGFEFMPSRYAGCVQI